jgi:hypothetical protein
MERKQTPWYNLSNLKAQYPTCASQLFTNLLEVSRNLTLALDLNHGNVFIFCFQFQNQIHMFIVMGFFLATVNQNVKHPLIFCFRFENQIHMSRSYHDIVTFSCTTEVNTTKLLEFAEQNNKMQIQTLKRLHSSVYRTLKYWTVYGRKQ